MGLRRHGVRHAVLLAIAASSVASAGQQPESALPSIVEAGRRQLTAWLGPLDFAPPEYVDEEPSLSWRADTDRSRERRQLAALAADYWAAAAHAPMNSTPLLEALAHYTGVRLIHELLRDDHRPTFRFLGGLVSYTSPHLRLTNPKGDPRPAIHWFPDADTQPPSQWRIQPTREVLALATLERYLGWPTMQTVLARIAAGAAAREVSVATLAETAEAITGRELDWFFIDAFSASRRYDYAVTALDISLLDTTVRSTVTVARLGDATFTGSVEPPVHGFDAGRGIEVLVRFADGTAVTEHWDGRSEQRSLVYDGHAPVVAAGVDPDDILLLDADRFNNGIRTDPIAPALPARLSLHWLAWLQDAVLVIAAVL
jgi:hypothetical protein